MHYSIFTNIKNRQSRQMSVAEIIELISNPKLQSACESIATAVAEARDEDAQALKAELPAIVLSERYKPGAPRKAGTGEPTGLFMIDYDYCKTSDELAELQSRVKSLSVSHPLLRDLIVAAHTSPRMHGVHVWCRWIEGCTSVEECQKAFARMADLPGYDEGCKDPSRCSFLVHKSMFFITNWGAMERNEEFAKLQTSSSSSLKGEGKSTEEEEASLPVEPDESLQFKGIPYAYIIDEWWRRTGGEPKEGERNVKLHKLAVNLRSICDNRRDLLLQVMPRLGLSETELRSIVDSACKEEPKGVSRLMRQIIDDLKADRLEDEGKDSSDDKTLKVNVKKLPMGLKETLSGVPESMHMPVLCGVLPLAAAYADMVEVEYCDGNMQHLGLMSIIRGEQASNKSVVKTAVDVWRRQFDAEDAAARKREDKWKERKKARRANEKAPDDPKVLIRVVPVTVSCSTLLKRQKNAHEHCLYSFGEELDTLRKTNGAGSWSSKYDIYRLSFDRGEWGQDYNSDQAESGVVKVAYNWTMLGTNGALQKCFRGNIENGLSSRVLIAEMPDSAFAKMTKFGRRTEEEENIIQDAVTRLRGYSGFIDTPRLRKEIERWVEEKRVEAAKNIDRVMDTYRRRAAVIGFRCGVVFHLLEGTDRESKACLDFARLMAEYCLRQQTEVFGEALLSEMNSGATEAQRRGANSSVFDQLPPVFTRGDLSALKPDCTSAGIRMVMMRWKRDGWIEPIDQQTFRKRM